MSEIFLYIVTINEMNRFIFCFILLLRAGRGLTPYEDEIISWTDSSETRYEINAVSLASHYDEALWEFYTPSIGNFLIILYLGAFIKGKSPLQCSKYSLICRIVTNDAAKCPKMLVFLLFKLQFVLFYVFFLFSSGINSA